MKKGYGKGAWKYKGVKCYKCGNEAPNCKCKPLNWSWNGYPMQLQEGWSKTYAKPLKRFSKHIRKEAMWYYRLGYRQVSRKYCSIQVYGKVTNPHGIEYMSTVGESITVSEEILTCMRRINSIVSHYKYGIPARIKLEEKKRRREDRERRAKIAERYVSENKLVEAEEIFVQLISECPGHQRFKKCLEDLRMVMSFKKALK